MSALDSRDFENLPNISEYYARKTIFITGGTGFMGKILIEKLLYSCPDLDRIYLLLRPKRGVDPDDRLSGIYANGCFDRLRKERPGAFESKVFCIAGDCSELGLGLSVEDRALLVNRTNIIFHVAASVRFDDLLKVSVRLNLRGTIEMIELAKDMQHLESFVHVSTAYANCNQNPIEEIVYPPHADWREVLDICDNIDDHTLNILTSKYMGGLPNTYVFAKQLAEQAVSEQRGVLPAVIIRPSIVVSTYSEPVPGWNDNFNGPVGLIVAGGKGILRTAFAEPNVTADYIPVDVAVKGFIVASWIRGTRKLESTDDIPVYNASNNLMGYSITMEEILTYGVKITYSVPLDNVIWSAGTTICNNKLLYYIQVMLLHVLPAIFLDTLLWILGKNTMVLKLQRRIYLSNLAIAYFLSHEWRIFNKNFISLRSKIKEEDNKHFNYVMENVDMYEYFKDCAYGAKKYLLKEKDEDLPKARIHYRRMYILSRVVKYIFYAGVLWWFIRTDLIRNIFDSKRYDTALLPANLS